MAMNMAKLRVKLFILSNWIHQFKPIQAQKQDEYKSCNSRPKILITQPY